MANIFLNSGEIRNSGIATGDKLFGNTGIESATIGAGITGLSFNQTIESLTFASNSEAYTYKGEGNNLLIYSGGVEVARVIVQDDADGTVLTFGDGTVSAKFVNGGLLLGTFPVPTAAPGVIDIGGGNSGGGTTPDVQVFDQTFNLTESSDTIPGVIGSKGTTDTSGNNLIVAGTVNSGLFSGSTLGATDNLNAGTGTDYLRIIAENTLLGGDQVFNPFLSGTEVIQVQNLTTGDDVIVNLTNVDQTGLLLVGGFNTPDLPGPQGSVQFNDIRTNVIVAADGWFGGEINAQFESGALTDELVLYTRNSFADFEIDIDADNAGTDIDGLVIEVQGQASEVIVGFEDGGSQVSTSLTIAGSGVGVEIDEDDSELEVLTKVDSTGFTGTLDLDLGDNDQAITFIGGNGNTTLLTGNGNSTITTGAGSDNVEVGSGNNTINTGAGNDEIVVENGGNQTINAGAGDDFVEFDSAFTLADLADGGAGTDTIKINVDLLRNTAGGLTANTQFNGRIAGFEKLYANNFVDQNLAYTIDLKNADNINYVITEGTATGIAEIQTLDFNAADASGGSFFVDFNTLPGGPYSIQIEVPANATATQVAAAVVTAFNNGDFADVTGLVGAVQNGDDVVFTYDAALGNLPANQASVSTSNDANSTLTYNAGLSTAGTAPVYETFTVHISAGTGITPATYELQPDGPIGAFTLTENQTIDEIGAQYRDLYNATSNRFYNATYNSATDTLTFVAITPGVMTDVTELSDSQGIFDAPVVTVQGAANTAEVQVYDLNVPAGDTGFNGRIVIAGVVIPVPEGTSTDELGGIIGANETAIVNAIEANTPGADVTGFSYDTGTNRLTITYSALSGDVPNVTYVGDNNAGVTSGGGSTLQQGQGAPGTLTLNYTANGGTLELVDDNDGVTIVNSVGAALDPDTEFNIVLSTADSHNGSVVIDDVETLNVVTSGGGVQSVLGLTAQDVSTLDVSGSRGVNFINAFANLTLLDASGIVATTGVTAAAQGVTVVTGTTADAELIGGIGNDSLTSGAGDDSIEGGAGVDFLNGGAGVDTIDGGAGNDRIVGGTGADTLTGGAGNDDFIYLTAADSQGVTVDTILDFVAGTLATPVDQLDFSAISGGTGSFTGNANGYGAVLTSLVGNGNAQAVYDTSTDTLYVDANGDAILDNNDLAIDFASAITLTSSNFIW